MHLKPISRELRRELYGRRGAQSGLGNHGRNKVSKARGCKERILVQTHKCSLIIMGLHIFEVNFC